jgi:hypothetical protein
MQFSKCLTELLVDISLQVPKTLLLKERLNALQLLIKVLLILLVLLIHLLTPSLVDSLLLTSPHRLQHSLVSQAQLQFRQLLYQQHHHQQIQLASQDLAGVDHT